MRLDLARLDTVAQDLFLKGLAPSTTRSYNLAKHRYLGFCQRFNLVPVPLSEFVLCRYVAFLSDLSLKYQTIKSYLSALRHLQIAQGFSDPFTPGAFPQLEYVLKGVRRSPHISPQLKRLPITLDLLRKLYAVWSPSARDLDTHLLWAACCLAFFGFVRSGEITSSSTSVYNQSTVLLVSDVAFNTHLNPSVVAVTIKCSKTDPFRSGVTLFLGRTADVVCPVKSLASFLAVRVKASGPLFTFQDGSYLTRGRLVAAVRDGLSKCGIDPSLYNGHSFRIGAATTAAQRGIPDSTIQMLGRWQSTAYLCYIRTPRSQLTSISSQLV